LLPHFLQLGYIETASKALPHYFPLTVVDCHVQTHLLDPSPLPQQSRSRPPHHRSPRQSLYNPKMTSTISHLPLKLCPPMTRFTYLPHARLLASPRCLNTKPRSSVLHFHLPHNNLQQPQFYIKRPLHFCIFAVTCLVSCTPFLCFFIPLNPRMFSSFHSERSVRSSPFASTPPCCRRLASHALSPPTLSQMAEQFITSNIQLESVVAIFAIRA
jgi:hypothetical protein